uniref:Uncharacterized protein n=1 Tax=Rhizophora mucronata TaxID=61149 RepID=A0A2P2R3L0_RHIMU
MRGHKPIFSAHFPPFSREHTCQQNALFMVQCSYIIPLHETVFRNMFHVKHA